MARLILAAVAGFVVLFGVMLAIVALQPQSTPLRDVMSSPVQTAAPNISPSEALTRMLGSGYRHLPVLNNEQQVVGMVSVRQLLMRRVSEQHNNIDVLAAYVEAGGPG